MQQNTGGALFYSSSAEEDLKFSNFSRTSVSSYDQKEIEVQEARRHPGDAGAKRSDQLRERDQRPQDRIGGNGPPKFEETACATCRSGRPSRCARHEQPGGIPCPGSRCTPENRRAYAQLRKLAATSSPSRNPNSKKSRWKKKLWVRNQTACGYQNSSS